jgi:cytochrome c-type biogenesis protein CcmH
MAPTDRQEMIVGMVDQLSERLGNEGGSVEEWGQLIRALTVLGRNNQAKAIFDEAHTVFEDDTAALNTLSQLGSEIGFE